MNNYKQQRENTKRRLFNLGITIKNLMETNPDFRNIKKRNVLIRYIWNMIDQDIPSESITRLQRKILADHPELDTENNIEVRANSETAYHEFFRECESL